jgi:hypothetical protein
VLGAGLEPACLSAYAPQTYVSAISPPERLKFGVCPKSSVKLLVLASHVRLLFSITITSTSIKPIRENLFICG